MPIRGWSRGLATCRSCDCVQIVNWLAFFLAVGGEIVVATYGLSTLVCRAGALAIAPDDLTVKTSCQFFCDK